MNDERKTDPLEHLQGGICMGWDDLAALCLMIKEGSTPEALCDEFACTRTELKVYVDEMKRAAIEVGGYPILFEKLQDRADKGDDDPFADVVEEAEKMANAAVEPHPADPDIIDADIAPEPVQQKTEAWGLSTEQIAAAVDAGNMAKSKPSRRTSAGLRDILFDALDRLELGDFSPDEARAVATVADAICKTVKLEMEAEKMRQSGALKTGVGPSTVLQLGRDAGQ